MKAGQILEITATDKGIKQDMPAWCKSTGNECLGIEEQNGEIKVFVKKTSE
jgi:TusA-related sulfurtransferase